ncbi:MAG: hypothetical protein N2322_07120, partial [Terrimicrobiaceae bacterium]|nr:hypothetical protein [Terrimicrobiaceae bacterium]
CGLAGLAGVLLSRTEGFAGKWVPRLWIEWGIAGALASLFFYLLEYFPFAMGWRLEVNHPLWALAWLGGSFIIAEAGAMAAGRPLVREAVPRAAVLLGAGLAMAAPVVLALGRGSATFWVSDPWLLELHHRMIFEFQSLPSMLAIGPKNMGTLSLAIWPVAGIVAGIALWRAGGFNRPLAIRLVVAGVPALTMLALALVQVRWLSAFFPLLAGCVWLLAAEACRRRWVQGILVAAGAAALALGPAREAGSQARLLARIEAGDLPGPVRGSLFLRDVAHRLNQASPSSPPVVLCGPNDATELAYYGALRTVGTLYWENLEGLRRAADLFAEAEEGRVKQALEEGGFSHLVLTAWDPNALVMAALGGRGATTVRKSFIARVLAAEEGLPDWLRPLCYPIPGPDGLDAESVRLFAFVPMQG